VGEQLKSGATWADSIVGNGNQRAMAGNFREPGPMRKVPSRIFFLLTIPATMIKLPLSATPSLLLLLFFALGFSLPALLFLLLFCLTGG
jgi:hypothetical protein